MKIIRFTADGATRVGALEGDAVVELPGFGDTQALIAGGAAALDAARKAIAAGAGRRPLASVRLAAPIVPSTVLCSGSNYTDHNKEKANTPISGKEPEFFVKTADCVIGPGDTIVHDERLSKKLDAETELAIVIGKAGRHIPVERALEHVFGYTVANDVTARERQVRRNEQGFTWYEVGRGKAFETACPLGPCIVTADEIPDPQKLRLRTRINGELRQSASTGEHDLLLRAPDPLLLDQLHAEAGVRDPHRHAGRHRVVDRPGARREMGRRRRQRDPRAGEGLPQAGRRDRERAGEDRGAEEHGRHGLDGGGAWTTPPPMVNSAPRRTTR